VSVVGVRVLAVFAHPDDESLLVGGLLAAVSAGGGWSMVLSLTRGEHGPRMVPGVETDQQLADLREQELREAAAALGVNRAECWGLEDGAVAGAEAEAEATARLGGLLSELRPDLVITFSEEGLYGHSDHRAAHRLVLAAARDAGVSEGGGPPVYGVTWPRGLVEDFADAMARRGLASDLWGIPPAGFGADRSSIDWVVDSRSFVTAKLAAIACHRSQTGPDHLFGALPEDLGRRYLGREYFVRLTAVAADDALPRLAGALGLPVHGGAAVGA
jgi:LmbE family N-acetylglucosaminyl deacetylase